MKTSALSLFATILTAGCGGGGTTTAAPDMAGANVCLGANCVVVNSSHYNPDFSGSGSINTIKTPDLTVTAAIDTTLDPDTAIHIVSGKAYMLNQDSGSLRIYDPSSWTSPVEISTGDSSAPNGTSFPRDFYVSGTKVYVAFSGNPSAHAIGVLDLTQPDAGVTKWIAVPTAAADSDGKPEASNVYPCNGTLYVSYADYTISGQNVVYAGGGRIASIDLASDTLGPIIQLTGQNAGMMAQDGASCGTVLIATSGQQTSVPDGTSGLERVDLAARSSMGLILKDTDLAGRPLTVDEVSPTLAFVAVYFDPQSVPSGGMILSAAKVIAVNPKTATVIGDVTGKSGFVNFARVSADKKLYVGMGQFAGMTYGDRLPTGLYIGPADGTMLPTTGIDLGQTPASIAFE